MDGWMPNRSDHIHNRCSQPASKMNVTKDIHVTVKEGDMELHMGKALSSFHYKGQEKFVFRTAEIEPLAEMLLNGKRELDAFYAELKSPPSETPKETP